MMAFFAMMAIGVPFTGQLEGNKQLAYLDGAGIPTICRGETDGVKLGDKVEGDACDFGFHWRFGVFAWGVDTVITEEMSPKTWAALTSVAYNIGMYNFTKSTFVKLFNAGQKKAACKNLEVWNKITVHGTRVVSKGLQNRRSKEIKLCLEGLNG